MKIPALSRVAKEKIKTNIKPEYQKGVSEAEGLGMAIAVHFDWNGEDILECFYHALEEINYHSEAKVVKEWIDKDKAILVREIKAII